MRNDDTEVPKISKVKRGIPAAHTGLLTLTEASAVLGVSKITLRRWTKSGALRCVRIGRRKDRRFRPADLEEFIAAHLREPAALRTSAAGSEAEGMGIAERILPLR
jgi:excisionase family DNA binding protein